MESIVAMDPDQPESGDEGASQHDETAAESKLAELKAAIPRTQQWAVAVLDWIQVGFIDVAVSLPRPSFTCGRVSRVCTCTG